MSEFAMFSSTGPNSPYEDNRYLFEGEDESMDIIELSTKDKIIDLLRSTDRPGIDALLGHMQEIGFFEAPCSTQHHLSCEGGLAEHSLNVYNTMHEVESKVLSVGEYIPNYRSIIISGSLHDLGKAAYHGKDNYIHNILKSGSYSRGKPYVTNPDRLYISHEIVSLQIASKFIELTEEEEFAILYHNGLYVASGRDIQGKERPLQQLLHFADMWCSRFIEKGDSE
jgi:23S rRNA maturation-related 3'-5' exoribonuclease YhaM